MAGRKSTKKRARENLPSAPGFNADESPLNWLVRRRDKHGKPLITREEFEAGERLRADFTFANLGPRMTSTWSDGGENRTARRVTPGLGLEMQDNAIAARERFNRALHVVGPELSGVLVDVCCYLKGLEGIERAAGWPQRCGKVILQLALQRLARHYGILRSPAQDLGDGEARPRPEPPIRHWGAAGYKPKLT